MPKSKLYAHVLLDRSGSMEVVRDATIDAFNEYVNGLAKDTDLDARVSLSLFDAFKGGIAFDQPVNKIAAADCKKLTRDDYAPRGGTPLNDAIGMTIQAMDTTEALTDEKFALVILTDGQENSSHEFTTAAIKAMIEGRQKDKGWLVIYLGANQDAFTEGTAMRGTAGANTMSFDVNNVQATMAATLRSSGDFAKMGLAASAYTTEERAASMAIKKGQPVKRGSGWPK